MISLSVPLVYLIVNERSEKRLNLLKIYIYVLVDIAEKAQSRLGGLINDDCEKTRKMALEAVTKMLSYLHLKLANSIFTDKTLLSYISALHDRLGKQDITEFNFSYQNFFP